MYRTSIETLEFNDLSVEFQPNEPVLSAANIQLPMNSIVWIRGDSGSGKSVVAKILAGLLMPTKGDFRVNGQSVQEMSFEEFLPFRRNIGYSFDFGGLINNRDIVGNLMLPIEYHQYDFGTPDQLVVKLQDHLKVFELEMVARQRPSAVLGRSRKAACVARAVFHDPEMVVLDDPSTGLNPQVKQNLVQLLLSKFEKNVFQHIFIASEDVDFMSQLSPIIIDVSSNQLHIVSGKVSA